MSSKFDKLLIMLGNFHLELAFFGVVGTYLADCGVEYILTECHILTEGSMNGFIRAKFTTDVIEFTNLSQVLWRIKCWITSSVMNHQDWTLLCQALSPDMPIIILLIIIGER